MARKRMIKVQKTGDKFYAYGFMLVLPNIETGERTKLTFQGSFDRRQLRKMLRKTLVASFTTEQLDMIIDEYGTRLRPMSRDEMQAMYTAMETDDA